MDVNEILSAFVDGERIEPAALASALGAPGSREALLDFILLRAAFEDESRPSEAFVGRMRQRLGGQRMPWRARPLPLVAAAAVLALAVVGAFDLGRRFQGGLSADDPPPASRVIRYEPGVDWMPVTGR